MTYPSEYQPGQVLTATDLNASFDAKTENDAAAITGGSVEGLDHAYVTGSTESVSPVTGALVVTGGVGIGLRLNVAGKLTAAAGAAVQAATVSTDPTTGALTVVGGVGIGGSVNVGGGLLAVGNLTGAMIIGRDITNAVDPVTGALTTAGGAGIAKDLHVGGSTAVGGGLSVQGDATVAGSVSAGSIVIAPGGGITFGDGSTQDGAPIPEAPSDGIKYGRKDAAWAALTDLPEAPVDGKKHGRMDAAWAILTDLPEAPLDGQTYGRKSGAWANTGGTTVNATIEIVDGAAPNQILPTWAPLNFGVVSGTAFTKHDATTLAMVGDGPTVIQIAISVAEAHGGSVVFGYSIGAGPVIEFGRTRLESVLAVKLVARWNALLHTGDLVKLWISSDIAYSTFAWNGGQALGFLNQTTGVPEAPIDSNQYTRKGAQWVQVSASGMWRGDTPPVDVERYPQWYNTNTSTLYVYYDDGDSAQWVICVPVPGTDEMTGAIWGSITGTLSDQDDLALALAAKVTQGDTIKAADGAAGDAGLTFLAEVGTGLYRASAGRVVMTNAGQDVMAWDAINKKTTAFGPIVLSADPVAPMDAATKQYVDANAGGGPGGGIPDAPDDGVLYGRQSLAWVPVPAGGGAVTYPLLAPNDTKAAPSYSWASSPDMGMFRQDSQTIAFAVGGGDSLSLIGAPTYGELSVYPSEAGMARLFVYEKHKNDMSGNVLDIAVGSGSIGINSSSTFGTPYDIGFNAPNFNFNGNVLLSSLGSSAAAPALAFMSEKGLGWYRESAGTIASVANGALVSYLGAANTDLTNFILFPRTAGQTILELRNSAAVDNIPVVQFKMQADGNAVVQTNGYGTYTRGSLILDTPVVTITGIIDVGGESVYAENLGGDSAASNIQIYPAFNKVTGPPGAWPTTNGGLLAVRGSSSPNYGQGAVSVFSGSGNSGVSLFDGATSWGAPSDDRLKTLDSDISDGLAAVLAIRPIRFKYITDSEDHPMRVGLSAQSVQTHIPEAITEVPEFEGVPTYLSLRYAEVIPHLVSAIKTLNENLTTSQTKVATLEHKLQAINDALDSL